MAEYSSLRRKPTRNSTQWNPCFWLTQSRNKKNQPSTRLGFWLQSICPMSSPTNVPSTFQKPKPSALWWSMQTGETLRLRSIKNKISQVDSIRNSSGKLPIKSSKASKVCTNTTSFTETLSALIFSLLGQLPKSEIWIFRKLLTMGLPPPKQALLTIQVLKYGKGISTITNAIFGHSDASYMKCAACCRLLGLKISQDCLWRLPKGFINKFRKNILKTWKSLFLFVLGLIRSWGQVQLHFCKSLSLPNFSSLPKNWP